MAATTEGIATPRRNGDRRGFPVGAGVKCNAGAIAVIDGGFVVPGTTDTGLTAVGVFEETVDNTDGSNGDLYAEVISKGWFKFTDAADATAIDLDDIGSNAYITDDQTITITTTGRSVAGEIKDVDSDGVWIEFPA